MLALGPIFDIGSKLIDKLFPDPTKKAEAQLELLKLQQQGELQELQTQLSVILAEAQSSDKWTSRARPSFLYVCYFLILLGVPIGLVAVISPATSLAIAEGFKAWLLAIPSDIISLMKFVMLGYIGGRTIEKVKGVA